MQQIPAKIQAPYELLIFDKAIPRMDHPFYKKWLRYYQDFCVKYHYESSSKESLPHFIQKLRQKKQNNQQQRQASDAISLYYEIESIQSSVARSFKNKKEKLATKKENSRITSADCENEVRPVFAPY